MKMPVNACKYLQIQCGVVKAEKADLCRRPICCRLVCVAGQFVAGQLIKTNCRRLICSRLIDGIPIGPTIVQSVFLLKMFKFFYSYEHIKTHTGHYSVFTLWLFCLSLS